MLRKLRSLRGLITIGVLLVAGGVAAVAVNGYSASRQVAAIAEADKAGQPTAQLIERLRVFSSSHIGAATAFTLASSYDRAVAAADAATAAARASSGASNQLYIQAQAACAGRTDSVTQSRCVQAYVSERLRPVVTPSPVPSPVLATYQYRFASPWWTSDAAGLLLAAGAATLIAALISLTQRRRSRG